MSRQQPTVTTDSRNCPEGSIFIALKGASFDGNLFADAALDKGCAYVVIDNKEYYKDDGRHILVDDCLTTFKELAREHRRQFDIPVIGITGTNGKTTTKELVSAVLAERYCVMHTEGNFNNILMITLMPVIVGFLFNHFFGKTKHFKDIQSIMPGISVIGLCLIVGGVMFTVHPQLMNDGVNIIAVTLAVVFCHNSIGYALGYAVGKLFRFNTAKKRTISIEVGMQNAGMATVLANNFFATQAAIAANPLSALSVVPCALSCAYHSISGTILAGLFNRFGNPKPKQ